MSMHVSTPDANFDAYGAQIVPLLARLQAGLKTLLPCMADHFYEEIEREDLPRAVMRHVSLAERQALKDKQAEHLAWLLHPQTGRAGVLEAGSRLGMMHRLLGLDGASIVRTYALMGDLFARSRLADLLPPDACMPVLMAVEARLQDELQAQMQGFERVTNEYYGMLLLAPPEVGEAWPDASRREIDRLGRLPGMVAALLLRADDAGRMLVEHNAGPRVAGVTRVLSAPGQEPLVVDPRGRGQGLAALAWRTRSIQRSARFDADPRIAFWRGLALEVGFRSLVTIPVTDPSGQMVAVIALFGEYPNQFESLLMLQFAQGLRQRWQEAWRRCNAPEPTNVIALDTAQAYREQLFAGGLEMHFQPIVDLHEGRPRKLEALARLRMPDGSLLAPGVFLPLLGNAELDSVFRLALDQALGAVAAWDAAGLHLNVSVNLPPSTLLHPQCPWWVEDALRQHGIAAPRLTLELLEDQRMDQAALDRAIASLKRLGVRLAMDDLGSGYSSLKRLLALPFETIKIDQGVVRQFYTSPIQTTRLIGSLIRIGHDDERRVAVEGLEDVGMVEAVMLLGADLGQGFALAHAMPAQQIPAWTRQFRMPAERCRVHSFLGAMALTWRHVQKGIGPGLGPATACPIHAFLVERGLQHSEGARLHARMHGAEADQLTRQAFREWLTARVIAEGRNGR